MRCCDVMVAIAGYGLYSGGKRLWGRRVHVISAQRSEVLPPIEYRLDSPFLPLIILIITPSHPTAIPIPHLHTLTPARHLGDSLCTPSTRSTIRHQPASPAIRHSVYAWTPCNASVAGFGGAVSAGAGQGGERERERGKASGYT